MEWLTSIDWFALACWLGAFVLIALGFAGTIVPAIPGLPMIAGGAWLIGWADNYDKVGWKTILFLAVLAVIGVIVDSVAQTAALRRQGLQKRASSVRLSARCSACSWGFSVFSSCRLSALRSANSGPSAI